MNAQKRNIKTWKTSRQWLGKSSTPEPMAIRSLITRYNQYLRLGKCAVQIKHRIEHLSELSAIEFLSPHVFSCPSRVFSCLDDQDDQPKVQHRLGSNAHCTSSAALMSCSCRSCRSCRAMGSKEAAEVWMSGLNPSAIQIIQRSFDMA